MDYRDRGKGQPHGQDHRQAPDHRGRTPGGHSEREPHTWCHLVIHTELAVRFCFLFFNRAISFIIISIKDYKPPQKSHCVYTSGDLRSICEWVQLIK